MYEFKLAVKDVNDSYVESPKAAMHVEKDFTIDFPDWLSIRKNDDIDAYIVENNANNKNVVRFVKDMYIPAENSIVFDIILNKAEVPAGFLVDGGIDELGRPCKRLEVDVTDENNIYYYIPSYSENYCGCYNGNGYGNNHTFTKSQNSYVKGVPSYIFSRVSVASVILRRMMVSVPSVPTVAPTSSLPGYFSIRGT